MSAADDPADSQPTEAWRRREEYIKQFEAALLAGRQPAIDDYLPPETADRRAVLIELVHLDQECRVKAGEEVRAATYLERYPELAGDATDADQLPPPPIIRELPEPRAAAGPPAIPGYEILDKLGRGGMGVVYKARQIRLNRLVALKMILTGSHAAEHELARFRSEAEAVARLQHPNIVQIHEVGETEGKPFFSLEFCDGGSLDKQLAGTPIPPRQAAQLVETLARAMDAAHQKGVIHRDLKPANVLLARNDVHRVLDDDSGTTAKPDSSVHRSSFITRHSPKITDFGLAKKLDEGSGQTASSAVMGTPSYMAPEQASGQSKQAGPAADIYALGAILYESLTGRPPFRAETPLDTLMQVVTVEPVRPRLLQPMTPLDLETVCLKCLQKEPSKRYATALALAEDLRRFQANEPIQARAVGRVEKTWRWCRRNPAVAGLCALLILMLVTIAIVSAVTAVNFYELAASEQQAKSDALDLAQSEARATAEARKAHDREVDKSNELRQNLSFQFVANGTRAQNDGDYALALLWYVKALQLDEGDSKREPAHRLRVANTWRQMPRLVGMYRHDAPLTWAEMSPDGKQVVTASYDGTARLWDVATGKQIGTPMNHDGYYVFRARFSPDGKKIATCSGDGTVRLWDSAARPVAAFRQLTSCVATLVFSPDGKKLAAGCYNPGVYFTPPTGVDPRDTRRVRIGESRPGAIIWDLEADKQIPLSGMVYQTPEMAFSGDGRRIGYVSPHQNQVTIGDVSTGALVAGPFPQVADADPNRGLVTFLTLNHDASRLIAGGYTGTCHLWNVQTGKRIGSALRGRRAFFTPDGSQVVGHGLWDAVNGQLLQSPPAEIGGIWTADLGPGGRQVVAAHSQGVRVWETTNWKPLTPVLRFIGGHRQLARHGRYLVVDGHDHVARVWDLAGQAPRVPPIGDESRSARYGADGKHLVTAEVRLTASGTEGVARLWDTSTGHSATGAFVHGAEVNGADISPDGKRIVTGSADGSVRFWDTTTKQLLGVPWPHSWPVDDVFFDTTGARLVAIQGGTHARTRDHAKIQVWDVGTGQPLWKPNLFWRLHVALSRDGGWLATAQGEAPARVWDLTTGQPITPELQHPASVHKPAFGPDKHWLATPCLDGFLRIWDLPSGNLGQTIRHQTAVVAVALSSDAHRLVTADRNTLRVWDRATGQPISPVIRPGQLVTTLSFSPDDRWVLASTVGGFTAAWDAVTGESLGPPWYGGASVEHAAFRKDGRQLVFQGLGNPAQLWDFVGDDRSTADWRLLAEAQAGCRLDATGSITPLTPGELAEAWEQLGRRSPQECVLPREQVRSWYVGRIARLQKDKSDAGPLALLNEALEEFPDDANFRRQRGIQAARLKKHALAVEDLTRGARDDVTVWIELARVFELAGKTATGIEDLSQRLRGEPGNGHLWLARAFLHLRQRQHQEALRDLTNGLERTEDPHGWAFAARAALKAEAGQWKAARDDIRAALARQSLNLAWQTDHVYTLLALKDTAAVKEALGDGGKLWSLPFEPGSTAAVQAARLGLVTLHGNPNACEQLLRPVLAKPPRDYPLLSTQALLSYRREKFPEARAVLDSALQAHGQGGTTADWLLLAMVSLKLKKSQEAAKWLDQAETWFTNKLPETEHRNRGQPLTWQERLELDWLRGEARQFLGRVDKTQ